MTPDLPVPFGPINTVTSFGSMLTLWKHLKFCRVMFVNTVSTLWTDYSTCLSDLAVCRAPWVMRRVSLDSATGSLKWPRHYSNNSTACMVVG